MECPLFVVEVRGGRRDRRVGSRNYAIATRGSANYVMHLMGDVGQSIKGDSLALIFAPAHDFHLIQEQYVPSYTRIA